MNVIVQWQTYVGPKFHIAYEDEERLWNFKCRTWYKNAKLHGKIVAYGDDEFIATEKQLCKICFGRVSTPKVKVSANAGRFS